MDVLELLIGCGASRRASAFESIPRVNRGHSLRVAGWVALVLTTLVGPALLASPSLATRSSGSLSADPVKPTIMSPAAAKAVRKGIAAEQAGAYDRAYSLYSRAMQSGSLEAQARLGYLLVRGFGVSPDPGRGFKLVQSAAQSGEPSAFYYFGMCLRDGLGVPANQGAALEAFTQGGKAGDPQCQLSLGTAFYSGYGIAQDFEQGASWYAKAAEQGLAEAWVRLGGCYLDGLGVPHSKPRAIECFRKAAEAGNVDGLVDMGIAHLKGELMPVDLVQAYSYFAAARSYGNDLSKTVCDQLRKRMRPADVQRAESLSTRHGAMVVAAR